MGRDQRRFGEAGDIPKALFGDVREIDENFHLVAGAHELFAGGGQAVAEIERGGKLEGDAMPEDVVAAPDRPQRSQARRVQHLEKVQIAVDGFGAFKVKNHRERPAFDRRAGFRRRLADRHEARSIRIRIASSPATDFRASSMLRGGGSGTAYFSPVI